MASAPGSVHDIPLRVTAFREKVWKYWQKHGRHDLPWRKTRDPYKVFVSEMMLQQTQVERVMPFYRAFLKQFPTAPSLAEAPLPEVLKAWNGLGYNRRAKFLHNAAKQLVEEYGGRVPKDAAALRALPGVGPYCAAAIRIFAFDLPDTMIETNIRTAFIHHFFPYTPKVHDREILVYAEKAAKKQNPRRWHWALMDYGAHLKKTHPNPSRQSAHHAKQPKFEGSLRQVRGAILRARTQGASLREIRRRYAGQFDEALASLKRDELI